jgi:hypothetical protein
VENKNTALEEKETFSEIGILGANKTKMLDSDSDSDWCSNSDLYLANSRLLSFTNSSTYDSHHFHYITADPACKSCTAGTFRTLDNVCKDCPVGTWSKDAASICCLNGQYEGSNAFCENCPPGKYLTWSKCRSSKKNDCRPCEKGKVRENKSQSRYSDSVLSTTEERFLHAIVT